MLLRGMAGALTVPVPASPATAVLSLPAVVFSGSETAEPVELGRTALPENVLRTPPKKPVAPLDEVVVGVTTAPSEPGLPLPYALALSRASLPIPQRLGILRFGGTGGPELSSFSEA